ncbi:MAG: hypothetical protein V7704_08265 [Aurantimonas endophytica]|uniref:hypothetical protein n=1 Tax=Aurantimonas endophytica TaxID=1522175 RepID=UPI0030030F27
MSTAPFSPPGYVYSEAIDAAAEWLASQPVAPSPIIPIMRARFGLTVVEACQACREAGFISGRTQ